MPKKPKKETKVKKVKHTCLYCKEDFTNRQYASKYCSDETV